MKRLTILLFSVTFVGCSHADNSSVKEREAEISKALASRTLAIGEALLHKPSL